MKFTSIFFVAIFATLFFACSNNEKKADNPPPVVTPVQPNTTPTPANTTTPVAGAVKHYTCPNNCANSGGDAAGTCPVCGTAYVHNAAYHNQTNNANSPFDNQQSPVVQPPQQQQQPAPAQNAAGVYHYTCANGCAGGSGSAGTCSACGGNLVHNPAYHN